ncbi:PQQ-binding-like beta-propeller repeat protein [Polaribacter sp. Z022]|uniref:outer membrane protein assembly factor BamB family protein n=1 Tax=Polaribacter sp. Z022 TaxID=2927125 RepID=UPI0020229ADB|nr:PQQ-binding-like beta-propeller repeat protein [Polaribacter sp. Z022]MCL7754587.1 PQQ-like beta-propeller repeat protein [Polaribacter sp. Z022]
MNHFFKQYTLVIFIALISFNCSSKKTSVVKDTKAIVSIDTDLTILKVRTAVSNGNSFIVANSYEGTLIGLSNKGKILWKNTLSGFINHDVYIRDIDNDGSDEILTANADGSIYCLNSKGDLQWSFKKNDAPMFAVSAIKKGNNTYVVAGGFDNSIYYLSANGKFVKKINSKPYSKERLREFRGKKIPKENVSMSNFIRTIKNPDGKETLVVLGTNNHMQTVGTLYFFNPLEIKPFKSKKITKGKSFKGKLRIRPIGDFKLVDFDNDGYQEIVLGASAHVNDMLVTTYNTKSGKFLSDKISKISFGYDIAHTEVVFQKGKNTYFTRVGSKIHLYQPGESNKSIERIVGKYAYNDICKIPNSNKVILASSQSGGSAIHIIDLDNSNWKNSFKNLVPKGKITTIIKNTNKIKNNLKKYTKPVVENQSQKVYLMTEKIPSNLVSLKEKLFKEYQNPYFFNSLNMRNVENWDRSNVPNEKYKKSRDRRKRYTLTSDESYNQITKKLEGTSGVAYWAGHGNDPYMFHINTTKRVIDKANSENKKTVLIYPEMEDHTENAKYLVNDLVYPLAEYAKNKNANIFLRNKHNAWLGTCYLEQWDRLMSGEFADVFVPSMEETTDKSMELSLAGRLGLWSSGVVNSWGTRAVPDNTSFDRSRQLGYQRLPNHFLRMLIFHTSYGAQFINNFSIDQQYMSIYWELIGKGALYVPKRNEILSFSPIHLSMKDPDHHFIDDGSNVKWSVFYDEKFEKENPFVLSRLNGSWPGAPVTEWDFSRYAAGVKDRRLNFLAPYKNGLVLITPTQEGVFAQKNVVRKKLIDNLHPFYKNILKEYITDGRNYYSADGKQTFKADKYYKVIEKEIKESSKKLPITVSGDVAWVVAQTAPKHLRLTIIDNGYINPEKSTAIVNFNNIKIKKIVDILNKEEFKKQSSSVKINIPLGAFRFIDIELEEAL